MENERDMMEDLSNPLDYAEEIFAAQEWAYSRPYEDQLHVNIAGPRATYTLDLVWHDDYGAVEIQCSYDFAIHDHNLDEAAKAICAANTTLCLGHFELSGIDPVPRFRHTSLFTGMGESSGADHIEQLVDIAVSECTRHQSMFELLSVKEEATPQLLSLSMMESAGHA